jgi:TetR/AcrR family transcriptional regulator, tetracycline repressor protein
MAESAAPVRAPLTRGRIFAAALEIIDAEGLSALSMRRLGSSLGVEAMAIYHHVPNKDALLAGVADLLLSSGKEMPAGMDWRAGLHWGADTLRNTLRAHPAAAPLITDAPMRTESSVLWVEGPLTLLTDAGFTPEDAVGLFHATLALLFGWIALEGVSLRRAGSVAPMRAELAAIAPTTAGLAGPVNDWSTGFDEALDALLDSWARRLPPGAKGAARATSAPRPAAASAWIVEKGGDHKGHKKEKGAKKKGKAKKKA